MKNFKSTTLLATSLVASLLISQTAMAGKEGTLDKYSGPGHPHATDMSSESAPISRALDAELFPTDQSYYSAGSGDRINYSIESKPISAELEAELFPDHSR